MAALHERICSVDGCVEIHRSKGLCNKHYQRLLKGRAMNARRLIPRIGPCLADDCDRPRSRSGLCSRHYENGRRRTTCPSCGGTMKQASVLCAPCYRAAASAHLPTEKRCLQCERVLPIDDFALRKGAGGAARWRSRCRECEAADSRLRAKNAHRDKSRKHLATPYLNLRKYAKDLGIPWAMVVERYPADNRCEICGRSPQEAYPSGRFVRLSLDHCHETGGLRGFLCSPCNTGLGQLGDGVERIQAALAYLLRAYADQAQDAAS